jgi:hypothetical protein
MTSFILTSFILKSFILFHFAWHPLFCSLTSLIVFHFIYILMDFEERKVYDRSVECLFIKHICEPHDPPLSLSKKTALRSEWALRPAARYAAELAKRKSHSSYAKKTKNKWLSLSILKCCSGKLLQRPYFTTKVLQNRAGGLSITLLTTLHFFFLLF